MKTQISNQIKTMKKLPFFILVAVLSFAFFACEETEDLTSSDDYQEIIDESYTSEVFDEIEDIGDEAVDFLDNNEGVKSGTEADTYGRYYRLSPCATVTRIYGDDTISVTIDFGEENCLCNDGRYRRGKIYIKHYGYYWGDGQAEIEYSFDNYFVDDNQLTGIKNVLRTINADGNRQSDIYVDGALILADDEGTITWHADRTREVIEGSDTHYKYDDVIEVTGSAYGTLSDGTEITSEITSPLIRIMEAGCIRYFVEGVRTIMYGDTEIIVDYGDGTCDNLADITRNGETRTVEIKRRRSIW